MNPDRQTQRAPQAARLGRHSLQSAARLALDRNYRLFGSGLLVIAFTHTLTQVFSQVHTTLFPILQQEFSLSLTQLGYIAAIPPLCQLLFALPTGLLSDRLGARTMLRASMTVAMAGCFLASQSLTPIMLIVAISAIYVNITAYRPAAYSLISRMFNPRDRLKALGIHGAGGTLGVSLGPLSISLLMGAVGLGWRQVYLLWMAPYVVGILSTLLIKVGPRADQPPGAPVSATATSAEDSSLLTTRVLIYFLYLGLRVMGMSMIRAFMALYLVNNRGLSPSLASLCIGANVFVGIVAAPVGGVLAFRFGEKRWLISVLGLSYACLGLGLALSSNIIFVILYLLSGFFHFSAFSATTDIMAKLSPGRQRGLGYALFFLPSGLMGAVAPVAAAAIADRSGLVAVLVVALAILVGSLVLLGSGIKLGDGHDSSQQGLSPAGS